MFPELSVTENICMGHHVRHPKTRKLDWKQMRKETQALLARMQLSINPDTLVKNLSVAQRHMVEIAKALSLDAKLVIMDEPTSALTDREVEDLYRIVRQLKAEGKAILFISHKFSEIFAICDYYTVLRDGQYIGEGRIDRSSEDEIIRMMIGRSLDQLYPDHVPNWGKEILRVDSLSQLGAFRNVSFTLREGEILGLFGLIGAGRSEVVRTIFGVDKASSGTITFEGKPFMPKSPYDAMRRGIALVPEDRQKQGLILKMSLTHNISLPVLDALSWKRSITRKKKRRPMCLTTASGWRSSHRLSRRCRDPQWGNQQKVVLAKWIGTEPKVLILDEPTKGIDVATKAAVHEFICEMAKRSGDHPHFKRVPEVIGISDRILVMHEGRQTAILDKSEANAESVMRWAISTEEMDNA